MALHTCAIALLLILHGRCYRVKNKRLLAPQKVRNGSSGESALGLLRAMLEDKESEGTALNHPTLVMKISHQLSKTPSEFHVVASQLTAVLGSSDVSWRSKLRTLILVHELTNIPDAVKIFSCMPALRRALAELRVTQGTELDDTDEGMLRMFSTEITKTCFVQSPRERPSLGNFFSGMYSVDEFITRGGQSEVWRGTELRSKQRVVIRFPLSLCASWPCTVEELERDDPEALLDMQKACELSRQAVGRYKDRSNNVKFLQQVPFAVCVDVHTSFHRSDPAFDVWEFVGDVSMAQGFFMNTNYGPLNVESKRAVLRQLIEAIVVLADDTDTGSPCCCSIPDGWCTTDFEPFIGGTSWAKFTVMKISGQRCPEGWVEAEDSYQCGPIVHHDINFNNVMLTALPRGVFPFPTIIDFGAARRCRIGPDAHNTEWSPAYSTFWVPFWLSDPHTFSRNQCWSYDIYAVGLAWLVMELLRDMPSQHLICMAAVNAGLIAGSSMDFRATKTQPVQLVHGCDEFEQDELLRQDAMQPVNMLLEELHRSVLNHHSFVSESHFVSKVHEFVVSKRQSLPEQVRSLPLLVPDSDILTQHVFPLLKECPRFPSESSELSSVTKLAEMLCVWQVLIHLRDQIHHVRPDRDEQDMRWVTTCRELQEIFAELQNTTFMDPVDTKGIKSLLKDCEFILVAARKLRELNMTADPGSASTSAAVRKFAWKSAIRPQEGISSHITRNLRGLNTAADPPLPMQVQAETTAVEESTLAWPSPPT